MATLNELKTQITNANALGREKIINKGGTVAQDADTVAIMGAIDSIPAGGGGSSDVTIVAWNGDTTGLETAELNTGESTGTFYKISDSVFDIPTVGEDIMCFVVNNAETDTFYEGEFKNVESDGDDANLIEFNGAFMLSDQRSTAILIVPQDNSEITYGGQTLGTVAHKGVYYTSYMSGTYMSYFILMPMVVNK